MLLITMSRCSHCNYRGWGVPASDILTRCFHQPIKCLGKKKPVFSYLNYIFHMPHGQKQAQYLGFTFFFSLQCLHFHSFTPRLVHIFVHILGPDLQ